MDAREYKLVFTGPMGAGKTTAIRTASVIQVVATEVLNNDREQCDKDTTTVAMDYGEVMLSGGSKLRLYGTPGQARFAYMWSILARGAVGVIVLLDGSRADALKDLEQYVTHFVEVVGQDRLVVAVGRIENSNVSLTDYNRCAQSLGLALPVVTADVRKREDVLMLLEILFSQVEIASVFDPVDGATITP
ncbi:MAG: ATP/GTP-binding protein [Xanthomonadales bacterium]|nr:ATP/GTP-binding protein [Xanthomonadales bacterium]